jgi:hypothetical protein
MPSSQILQQESVSILKPSDSIILFDLSHRSHAPREPQIKEFPLSSQFEVNE